MGTFAASRGARSAFYDTAMGVRGDVVRDFERVFRRQVTNAGGRPRGGAETSTSATAATAALDEYMISFSHPGASAPQEDGVDALLTPVAPRLPWSLDSVETVSPIEMFMNDMMTVPASLAGLPAISVPSGSQHCGLQVIGRYRDESTVLKCGAILESHLKMSAVHSLR